MKSVTKHYSNGEITIVWKNGLCIHSTKCWKGLKNVFNPNERPWIKPQGDTTEAIINQVNQCPSGALTYFTNEAQPEKVEVAESIKVEASLNGPLLVHGNLVITDSGGQEHIREKTTAFCRCGQSANKPFCDGSHRTTGFKG